MSIVVRCQGLLWRLRDVSSDLRSEVALATDKQSPSNQKTQEPTKELQTPVWRLHTVHCTARYDVAHFHDGASLREVGFQRLDADHKSCRGPCLGVDCVRRCSAGGETVCKLSLMHFLWHVYRDCIQGSCDERQIGKIFLSCSSVQV